MCGCCHMPSSYLGSGHDMLVYVQQSIIKEFVDSKLIVVTTINTTLDSNRFKVKHIVQLQFY